MRPVPAASGTPLRTREAGGFRLTECGYQPSFSIPRHLHDLASLVFAVQGTFRERAGSTDFDCIPYDVVVKPPEEVHSNRYGQGGARCLLIEVFPQRFAALEPVTDLLERPAQLSNRVVSTLAMRAYRELSRDDNVSGLALEALILEIITEGSRKTSAGTPPRWMATLRDYIDAHWKEKIALDDLAGVASVHAATVVRGFRTHLNCSPGDYVRRFRLDRAERELANSARPIADIAVECGFYDQSHFTRAFKRTTGSTPLEFRKARVSRTTARQRS